MLFVQHPQEYTPLHADQASTVSACLDQPGGEQEREEMEKKNEQERGKEEDDKGKRQ